MLLAGRHSGTQGWPQAVIIKVIKPSRRGKSTSCVATIVVAAAVAASAANAESRRIQVGTLTCSLSASIGLVVGSQRNVSCMFRGTSGEPDEPYTGTMTRVGLDVGLTTGSVIIWAVFANTNRYKGMLTGTYTGASAEMSLAAGLGANVLVEDRTALWRCSRYPSRDRLDSTLRPALGPWTCTRRGELSG